MQNTFAKSQCKCEQYDTHIEKQRKLISLCLRVPNTFCLTMFCLYICTGDCSLMLYCREALPAVSNGTNAECDVGLCVSYETYISYLFTVNFMLNETPF